MLSPYIEAQYADGYIHREDEQDHSPYVSGKNIFDDILHSRPVEPHGEMVRFSLIMEDQRYDIDWTELPDNARPVRFKKMESDSVDGIIIEVRMMGIDFGYQYTDENGQNVKEIQEIR